MNLALSIILIGVALILGAGVGVAIGSAYRKKVAEAEIGSAEQEAKRIVTDAMKTAEAKKKEAILFASLSLLSFAKSWFEFFVFK